MKLTVNNLRELYGKNLKYYRKQKKYTQEKLAEITNTDTTFISRVESGHSAVSFTKMIAFSKALNIEVFKFFQNK